MRHSLAALLYAFSCACAGQAVQREASPPSVTAPRVEVRVHEATGASPEQVVAMLTPAREPLQRCSSTGAATIRVRVTNRNGSLDIRLEPPTSSDPTLRECILAALSTIDLEESGSNAVGPRPSVFTSLLTISF